MATFVNCTAINSRNDGFVIEGGAADLINCVSENNGRHGFVTKNSNATLTNCRAINNGGEGFLDINNAQPLVDVQAELADAINADKYANAEYRKLVNEELLKIKQELQSSKPQTSILKKSFERIADIAKLAGSVKSAAELLNKIPAIYKFIVEHTLLF
jgi:hypothetical protein